MTLGTLAPVSLPAPLHAAADALCQRRARVQGVPGDPQHVPQGAEDDHQRVRRGAPRVYGTRCKRLRMQLCKCMRCKCAGCAVLRCATASPAAPSSSNGVASWVCCMCVLCCATATAAAASGPALPASAAQRRCRCLAHPAAHHLPPVPPPRGAHFLPRAPRPPPQVAVLFRSHSDLLTEFTYFLPDNSPPQAREWMRHAAGLNLLLLDVLLRCRHSVLSRWSGMQQPSSSAQRQQRHAALHGGRGGRAAASVLLLMLLRGGAAAAAAGRPPDVPQPAWRARQHGRRRLRAPGRRAGQPRRQR